MSSCQQAGLFHISQRGDLVVTPNNQQGMILEESRFAIWEHLPAIVQGALDAHHMHANPVPQIGLGEGFSRE
jgi:hypothetical protein